ncbi:heparan-alpha-glucosaminide N-acetyltransferase [Archaeoglobus neptunius]|uniref:heparan-alpha-glucosaminide N-acetyltransferase n=1 Tax=Archaeoglobus neptunius TaxID=2798580 RepID=UPI00192664C4|nr:heparan-alpha-glucosaminide N-acetyltransferase domain-containing protein [Archaeoglobus neptunius]
MRYSEIDFARGLAVVLMLVFHFFFDASYFGKIELNGIFWYYFPRFIGGMFIFISGYTLSIIRPDFKRVGKKALKLAALAAFITLVTYVGVPGSYVVYGIIHFFATATVAGYLFLKYPRMQLFAGLSLFLAGIYFNQLRLQTGVLVWLGLMPYGFSTLDYYPFLPWFGIFLLGMFAGSHIKPEGKFPEIPLISTLGKNSLKVYIIQHPVIILFLHLLYGDVLQQIL